MLEVAGDSFQTGVTTITDGAALALSKGLTELAATNVGEDLALRALIRAGIADAVLVDLSAGIAVDLVAAGLGAAIAAELAPIIVFGMFTLVVVTAADYFTEWMFDSILPQLLNTFHDPLILDLNGDGIHLSPLDGSTIHFDYDGDGFAERTGWVSADDGILVRDANGNGVADDVSELFGSSTQDGFAVLETFDTNGDGKIDASDAVFSTLRVWRDLDQDGVSDAGEMMTLAEAGIVSISLTRTDVAGTSSGHELGYEAIFTRADGTTGSAQTIYFQTDRQDTRADNTPNFTPAEGVDKLPQLPGSGQINSIAWKATQDAAFKADWTRWPRV
ncbi:hypothetical protein [Mesorhizobium sp. 43Arga]